MQFLFSTRPRALAVLLMLGGVLASSVVLAQGPPPGGDFGGPPPGGQGGPGGPPMGIRPKPTVARIPAEALEAALKLTAAQKTKIAQIQQSIRGNRPGGFGGPPPQGDNGQPPQGPRPGGMEQMRAKEQQAVKDIEAVLNADQRRQIPALLKEMQSLREVGLPPVLFGKLALTADQKQKIAGLRGGNPNAAPRKIDPKKNAGKFGAAWQATQGGGGGRGQNRDQVLALLTPEQRQAITAFEKAHPRPQGGFGGPPPGGDDGMPPPPPGGFGGRR